MRMAWRPSPMMIVYLMVAVLIVVTVVTRILFAREFLEFLRLLTA
jgi:hypothetical protein